MFWLLKKLLSLALLALAVMFLLNLNFQGKPVRQRIEDFIHTPLVQSAYQLGREKVLGYLQKDLQKDLPKGLMLKEPLDKVSDKDQEKLNQLVEKESKKK